MLLNFIVIWLRHIFNYLLNQILFLIWTNLVIFIQLEIIKLVSHVIQMLQVMSSFMDI